MKYRPLVIGFAIIGAITLLFIISLVFVTILLGGDRKNFATGSSVGVVEVKGVIVDGAEIIKNLKTFRENDNIKAIVLRIDSPGGVVAPSQEIYEEVKKTTRTKKVIVSMGSVAASGGYYISAPATKIFANPGTITGSIGVIMKFSNIEGLMGKIGLKAYTLKSGQFKDTGSPNRPMTNEDKAVMQAVIDSIQAQFVAAVAEGRKMPVDTVKAVADGRIFSGEQALQLKLVDQLGSLEDAIAEAAKMAGIKGEPTVVYPPKKKGLFGDMLVEEAVEKFDTVVRQRGGMSVNYELQ
jgi:protease-4